MPEPSPAGWYPDPLGRFTHRYWDGLAWTEHVGRDGEQHVDPPLPSPPDGGIVEETTVIEEVETTAVVAEAGKHRGPLARFAGRGSPDQEDSGISGIARVSRRVRRVERTTSISTTPSLAQMVQQLQLEEPREPLDEQIEVAGETYAVKGIKKTFRDVGMPITDQGSTVEDLQLILVPEPWNPHDANAVAVMVGPHQVGYLPKDIAPRYAGVLGQLAASGSLASGVGRIWAKTDAGVVWARVTLLIPEPEVFLE